MLVTLQRYLLIPVQYDSTLAPTAYKLKVSCDLQFFDHADKEVLGGREGPGRRPDIRRLHLVGGFSEHRLKR